MMPAADPLSKISRSICLSILIFIAINLAIGAFNQAQEFWKERDPISRLIPDRVLKFLYPTHSKAEVNQIYNESWTREFVYKDFVQFIEAPFKGKFVNVSEDGYRLVKNQGPWPPDIHNRNIFVFGGSQAFNYGITDEETVASRLQEVLRAGSGSEKICVYNFGQGSYFSSQERVLFQQLLIEGYAPDLAVFIHGGNDFSRLHDTLEFSKGIKNYMESSWFQRFLQVIDDLPLMELYSDIKFRLTTNRDKDGIVRLRALKDVDQDETHAKLVQIVARRANIYLNNIRMIAATAKAYNVETAFIFAPSSYYAVNPKYDLFAKSKIEVKSITGRVGYELIKNLFDRGVMEKNFIWLGDYAQHKNEPIFVDTGHYTAKFAKEIAGVIAGKLKEKDLLPTEKRTRGSDLVGQFLKIPKPTT